MKYGALHLIVGFNCSTLSLKQNLFGCMKKVILFSWRKLLFFVCFFANKYKLLADCLLFTFGFHCVFECRYHYHRQCDCWYCTDIVSTCSPPAGPSRSAGTRRSSGRSPGGTWGRYSPWQPSYDAFSRTSSYVALMSSLGQIPASRQEQRLAVNHSEQSLTTSSCASLLPEWQFSLSTPKLCCHGCWSTVRAPNNKRRTKLSD